MTTREKFLASIEAYLAKTGMSAREFGVRVKGDTAFVYRLREGKGLRVETIDKVMDWMARHPLGRIKTSEADHRSAA